ncbi:hypothetical protein HZP25_11720 [Elizabethkingia anophelis]|nr:hypothetical protein [Elizabethkingia anophelis]
MKTKYVKVPVSERLPEKSGLYLANWKTTDGSESWKTSHYVSIDGNCRGEWKLYVTDFLEEVPDHSEEILSMLEDVKNKFKPSLSHPLEEGQEEFLNQIEQLINKVKDNGK